MKCKTQHQKAVTLIKMVRWSCVHMAVCNLDTQLDIAACILGSAFDKRGNSCMFVAFPGIRSKRVHQHIIAVLFKLSLDYWDVNRCHQ